MSNGSSQATMSVEEIRASLLKQSFLPMEIGRIIKDRETEKTILFVVTADLKATWQKTVLDYEEAHGSLLPSSIYDAPASDDRITQPFLDLHGHDYPHGIPSWIISRPEAGASNTITTRIKKTAKIECIGFAMTPKCDKCTANKWECIALGPYEKGVKCSRCNYAGRPCSLTESKATKHKEDQQVTHIVRTAVAALAQEQDQNVVGLWESYVGTL